MARLPSETDLGGLPSANSGRPIASYDVTGYARGDAAIAAGVSDIGKGVSSAVRDVAAVQASQVRETDQLDLAKAESNYLIKTKQIRDGLSDETAPDGLKEKYESQFQQARDQSADLIQNPRQRELWTLRRNPDVEGNVIATTDKAFALQKSNEIASANDKLEELRQSALKTADPKARGEMIASGNALINGLVEAKYIDPVGAQKLRKNWTENYAIGAVAVLPPTEQVNVLRESPQSKDATLDRIGGAENASGNPAARSSTSSAMGDFQFINSTWLDTVKSHRPDLAKGHTDAELLALRADPKLSREMAGYLMDDNASSLRGAGVTPNPSNLYLAHFLGADTAAKVLKAAPGTPVADVVGADAIAANRSVLAGKTTDSVIGWASQKMGGVGPSVPQFDKYNLPGKEANLIEYHRDNLRNGTYADNGGDISTVYITGVTGPDGKVYNVPGFWDGKLHTDVKEITDHAAEAGWDKWPSYANGKQADAAAERDHKIVEADTTKFRDAKAKRGGLIDFIPEDKRVDMLQRAQASVLNDTRKSDSEAALEQYQVKASIGSDLTSMRQTGSGIDSLTPETVRRNFGSKIAQQWQDDRDDAHATWIATHDLSGLDDGQIEQRLASIAPKAGSVSFERQQKIYDETAKAANDVRKQRAEDPAGSVNDDPAVKAARAGLDQQKPETMKALQAARLSAQSKAGISEDAQSPISKAEALALTAPLRQMLPGQEREVLTAMGQQFKEQFGENADQAFAYALRVHKVDAQTAQVAARVVKKLGLGQSIDASDTAAVDSAKELSAADNAVNVNMPLSSASNVPGFGMGPMGVPKATEQPTGANVPVKAISDLRANPALAGDFDQKYGKGASKKILDGYPVR